MVTVAKEEGDVLQIGPVEEEAIIMVGTIIKEVVVEEVVISKDQLCGSHLINGTKWVQKNVGRQKITTRQEEVINLKYNKFPITKNFLMALNLLSFQQ